MTTSLVNISFLAPCLLYHTTTIKANEMVSWFFNSQGQVITPELIETMRAEKAAANPTYVYLFQRIEAERKNKLEQATGSTS